MLCWADVCDDSGQRKVYIGCTKGSFRKCLYNHASSFRVQKCRYNIKLADHIWKLKEEYGKSPSIKWSILKRVRSGRMSSRNCKLCQEEKLSIAMHQYSTVLLNRKTEIMSKCRYMGKNVLGLYDPR